MNDDAELRARIQAQVAARRSGTSSRAARGRKSKDDAGDDALPRSLDPVRPWLTEAGGETPPPAAPPEEDDAAPGDARGLKPVRPWLLQPARTDAALPPAAPVAGEPAGPGLAPIRPWLLNQPDATSEKDTPTRLEPSNPSIVLASMAAEVESASRVEESTRRGKRATSAKAVAEAERRAEEQRRAEAEREAAGRRAETERREAERKLAAEQAAAERRAELERVAAERRAEAQRREAERVEAERLAAARQEAEREAAERVEALRREAERLEAQRVEAERREAERREAERIETERLAALRQEADRLEAERLAVAPVDAPPAEDAPAEDAPADGAPVAEPAAEVHHEADAKRRGLRRRRRTDASDVPVAARHAGAGVAPRTGADDESDVSWTATLRADADSAVAADASAPEPAAAVADTAPSDAAADGEETYPWQVSEPPDLDLHGAATWDPGEYADTPESGKPARRAGRAMKWLLARADEPPVETPSGLPEESLPIVDEAETRARPRPGPRQESAPDVDDEAERREADRLEAERLEAERLEAERLEAERAEAARLEAERIEAERLEAERLEAERLEAERAEAARLEAERLEAERAEAARLEAERLEAERRAARPAPGIDLAQRLAAAAAADAATAAEADLPGDDDTPARRRRGRLFGRGRHHRDEDEPAIQSEYPGQSLGLPPPELAPERELAPTRLWTPPEQPAPEPEPVGQAERAKPRPGPRVAETASIPEPVPIAEESPEPAAEALASPDAHAESPAAEHEQDDEHDDDRTGPSSSDGIAPAVELTKPVEPAEPPRRRPRPGPGLAAAAAAPAAPRGIGTERLRPVATAATPSIGTDRGAPSVWTPDLVDKPLDDPQLQRFLDASEPHEGDDEPERPRRRVKPQTVKRLTRIGVFVAILAAAVISLRVFVVSPYYIPSESMEPTLHGCTGCNNDHILVDKISYRLHSPRQFDIVVFNRPKSPVKIADKVLVKRIIGLPGDVVSLKKGHVYINGKLLDETYVKKTKQCPEQSTQPRGTQTVWHVPGGDVFVMGDNRCDSEDSRVFGPIPESSIIGRAFMIIWPVNRIGFLH